MIESKKMFTVLLAIHATVVTACSNPQVLVNPQGDQVCPVGGCCVYNYTKFVDGGQKNQIRVEEKASAIVNFLHGAAGSLWTIQSAGTATVWCDEISTCQGIRLLGEGIEAHCTAMASCQAAKCEGADAKIVECSGMSSCQGSKNCDDASRTLLETDQGLPSSSSNDWIQTIRTDATTAIPLIVHLKHTKKQLQKLEEMFNAVSDPDNKAYGNHLTQDEVTSIVNHPEDKLQSVVQWLRTAGATNIIINKHRDSIKFSAKAKDVEILFDTEMYAYKHATRDVTLHRAALEYSVPETIASSVTLVSGLLRLPNLERFAGFLSESQSQSEQNTTWPKDCKGCNNRVTPGVLAARYSFPSPTVDDAPSTLSISEFQGQVWDQSDLNKFSTSCAIPFNITVDHENGTIAPGKACKIPILGTQFCGEALLDIEYAKAIAGPTVELTDIYQSSYNLLNWATDVENIDDANLIGVHSVSYGNDETQQTSVAFMNSCNAAFMKIGVRGVSILFASGDQGVCGRSGCGYKNGRFHPDFPSSSPYITSVGGTDFVTKNVIGDEKAWVSGGGGFSDTFPIPAYQTDAVAKYKSSSDANLPPSTMFNNTGRGYPDVAALAGQQNPYCIGAASMLIGIAGTSAATPVTAAIFARLNGVRVKNGGKNLGFLNPWIYKNAAAFNDVKQGCNSDNSKHGFTAIAGWDAATGVGTPNYSEMVKVL